MTSYLLGYYPSISFIYKGGKEDDNYWIFQFIYSHKRILFIYRPLTNIFRTEKTFNQLSRKILMLLSAVSVVYRLKVVVIVMSGSQISELPPTFTSHHPYLCKLGHILQSGPSNLSTQTSALSFWF